MNLSERANLIIACARQLVDVPIVERETILSTFAGQQVWLHEYHEESEEMRLHSTLRERSDDELTELASHLSIDASNDRIVLSDQRIWRDNEIRCFISHLSSEKDTMLKLAESLRLYGIHGFVAHETIGTSKKWQDSIEYGLSTCDLLFAFVTPGFSESFWCDQEVGWVLGRNKPIVIAVAEGISGPHGFLGSIQSLLLSGDLSVQTAADRIRDVVLTDTRVDQARLRKALVDRLANAGSFDSARAHLERLLRFEESLDYDDRARLRTALSTNSQLDQLAERARIELLVDGPPAVDAMEEPF